MTHALARALALVAPEIPPALVGPADLVAVTELAATLPPVVRCGFEVRLGNGGGVDLQQGIKADLAEQRALRRHLGRRAARGAWSGVAALLERWEDPGSALHGGVEDVWLEFDELRDDALSVFVGLARAPGPAAQRFRLACTAAESLGASLNPAVRRCFDACPPGGFVSHVGVMLGRPVPFARINVRRVDADLGTYLSTVGWRGDIAEATALARELRALADGLTVCLDVGTEVQPRLGLEAHCDDARWSSLIDALVARGWCTAAKRDAFLAWPGLQTPRTDRSWPAAFARDGLLRSSDHLTAVARALSHIKLVLEPEHAVSAKAYFYFEHVWLRPREQRERVGSPGTARRHGAAAAIEFLLASRMRGGWWRDFSGPHAPGTSTGSSDEYVTAYVATALAATGDARALLAAERAWTLLAARRAPEAGWGWNRLLPVDGDSTSWGLRLADAVGAGASPEAAAARRVLAAHRQPDGGIATYRPAARPRPVDPGLIPPDGSSAGWTATSHACVTAAAAGLGDAEALSFLRAAQRADGSWAAYWWRDDEFATALAARALAATGDAGDRDRATAATDWAAGRIEADGGVGGSPFATALAVQALAGRRPRVGARARAWLAERQHDDGGWPPSAWTVAPRPDLIRPGERSIRARRLRGRRTDVHDGNRAGGARGGPAMTVSPQTASVAFDTRDPAFLADPHPRYREWRALGPVVRLRDHDAWAVIGHPEARALLGDRRAVPRAWELADDVPASGHPFLRAHADAVKLIASFLLYRQPADHARLRRLLAPAFTPRALAERRARVVELCEQSVDAALARGRMDVVGDLARPLALTIAGEQLGIPESMHAELGGYARDLASDLDLFPRAPLARRERGVLAMVALADRLRRLLRDGQPGDGLLWSLDRARARGELSEREVIGHVAMLLFAGSRTTQHLIGAGVLALLSAPRQWRLVCERPGLVDGAVEEVLRLEPTSPAVLRHLLADVDVGPTTIPAGARVLVLLAAANRDPSVFPAPDSFDLERRSNRHLAFGYGAHGCIGAALARIEAGAAIGTLARRLPALRLDGPPEREPSIHIRGLASLSVTTR